MAGLVSCQRRPIPLVVSLRDVRRRVQRAAAGGSCLRAFRVAAVTAPVEERARAIARLAAAFDVAGVVARDAPVLILRAASGGHPGPEAINDLVSSVAHIFPGSVIIVPHEWTQEQIDAEAIRVAVQEERDRAAAASLGGENAGLKAFSRLLAAAVEAEREACAVLVESGPIDRFHETFTDVRGDLAAQIRDRAKAGAS